MAPRCKTARAVAALGLGFGFFAASAGLVVGLSWAGAELGDLVIQHARGSALIFGCGLVLALMSVAGVVGWALFPRTHRRLAHEYLFDGIDGPWLARWDSVGLAQAELGRVAAQP